MVRQLVMAAVVGWCCVASAAQGASQSTQNVPREERASRAEDSQGRAPRGADELARTAMHQLVELKLSEAPISDAIDKLRAQTGAEVFVNWKSLEAAGVGRHDPMSLHVRNIHASTALDLLLRVAAPEGPKLGWAIDNGVVTVSTADDLAKNVMVRVYDVRHLLGKPGADNDRAKKVSAILRLFTDRVDPQSWRDHGGATASIRELQGQLIVTQTPENHRAIVDLLQSLLPLFAPEKT